MLIHYSATFHGHTDGGGGGAGAQGDFMAAIKELCLIRKLLRKAEARPPRWAGAEATAERDGP